MHKIFHIPRSGVTGNKNQKALSLDYFDTDDTYAFSFENYF